MAALKNLLADLLTSKKAIAAVVGLILTLLARWGIAVPEEAITEIVAIIASYLVGQGIADHGKEAAKVQRAVERSSAPGEHSPHLSV